MANSPYVCDRCNTEWNTKTGFVEKLGKVPEGEEVKIPEFKANPLSYLPRSNAVKLESVMNTMRKSVNSQEAPKTGVVNNHSEPVYRGGLMRLVSLDNSRELFQEKIAATAALQASVSELKVTIQEKYGNVSSRR